ncbi:MULTISPECIES: 3'(2'),5'-bisphosphate nucleotidase CysQ [Rhodomicrobium]|uniref:3'(2'),5'-bisphosphate nucleotidase CysQ n=1 Tax=Rhodomicrobium TaxID=1068 RepID=UPI000B4A9472|nr:MULTISPECIES: 3'(2'),5'-bisphosphate nucleotidase CysQ [Rhodomicrobium]
MDGTDGKIGRDSLAADEALLFGAVRAAGTLALSFFGRGLVGTHKADNSPVSEADYAVDKMLRERLTGERPNYGWLSEETVDNARRLDADQVWIVDPIDGTRAFLAGTPEWTIAAALVDYGQPVLAAVYNPATAEMFTARRGGGAFLNGMPISVTPRDDIAECRMIATKGFFKHKIWTEPWPNTQNIWFNSVAYRLALIAAGRADATLSLTGKSEWDLAAPALLVQEARGKVTDATGAAITFNQPNTRINGLVAAAPALHDLLVARTRPVAAKEV